MNKRLLYFFAFFIPFCLVPAMRSAGVAAARGHFVTVMTSRGTVCEVSVEEYAARVVAAEEYVDDPETAKALAVTVRSAAEYVRKHGGKHEGFDFCVSPDCCFPYAEENFGAGFAAAEATRGTVIAVGGEAAMTAYCVCSGRGTGNAPGFPALTAAARPECRIHKREMNFDCAEIEKRLGSSPEKGVCLVYGGGVCEYAVIGDVLCEGKEVAQALGLPSLCFEASVEDGQATFICFGSGCGYGLDLCFAADAAKRGSDWKTILKQAFPKAELLTE